MLAKRPTVRRTARESHGIQIERCETVLDRAPRRGVDAREEARQIQRRGQRDGIRKEWWRTSRTAPCVVRKHRVAEVRLNNEVAPLCVILGTDSLPVRHRLSLASRKEGIGPGVGRPAVDAENGQIELRQPRLVAPSPARSVSVRFQAVAPPRDQR